VGRGITRKNAGSGIRAFPLLVNLSSIEDLPRSKISSRQKLGISSITLFSRIGILGSTATVHPIKIIGQIFPIRLISLASRCHVLRDTAIEVKAHEY
jgi:hypothetical protein